MTTLLGLLTASQPLFHDKVAENCESPIVGSFSPWSRKNGFDKPGCSFRISKYTMTAKALSFQIDLNVLNHLGVGLYSSTPAVLTEIVANAWDADATEVDIQVDKQNSRIVIRDNGHGMDLQAMQSKFLRVGYARRVKDGSDKTPILKRPVMGRKGIGKLGIFSLAQCVDIFTKMENAEIVSGRIDVKKLRETIEANDEYFLDTANCADLQMPISCGTMIVLRDLTRNASQVAERLLPRIARRFSVWNPDNKFSVKVDGVKVGREHQGYQPSIQFLWTFDSVSDAEISPLCVNLVSIDGKPCKHFLDGITSITPPRNVSGFIATVQKPQQLKQLDANLNQIAIFARKRVFQEDMLKEVANSKVFNSYLVGEIHIDYLDNDATDRATASREAVKHDDPLYVEVRNFLTNRLTEIQHQWDEWRKGLGYDKSEEPIPIIKDWLDSIANSSERKLAERLVTNISNSTLSNDIEQNAIQKGHLYRSAIVGFEKLRAKQMLDKIENISDVLSPEFQAIFARADDVEATYYREITASRLEIITKFNEIVEYEALEKIAQKYLFEHLWLLDPTWGRVSGTETIEKDVTEHLKKAVPDTTEGARLDIAFRQGSGKFAIVELKRPGKTISFDDLLTQVRKYRVAVTQLFKDHPDIYGFGGRQPIIESFVLVDHSPCKTEEDNKAFASYNCQILTYKGLLTNAKKAYQEYLDVHSKTSKIDQIIAQLGYAG